jgi:hypothetical protein
MERKGMMIRDQKIDAFIASLRLEGVSKYAIDWALTRVENIKMGESISSGNEEIRIYAQAAGSRFRAIR